MSRIEDALEKAKTLRKEGSPTRETAAKQAKTTIPPLPPFTDKFNVAHPLLVSANDPHSAVSEEYRKLKSTLVKMTHTRGFSNTIMVTSSVSSEGKSIVALNLALSLAQEYDFTVLLVDADMRKPSLHAYLGLEPRLGLAQCILEDAPMSEALVRVGGKLSLLSAGRQIRNPGEIFSSQRVKELFLEMKHRYPDRYIIIDTPPVLPFAETRTLSRIVDGTIFVVKEGLASVGEIGEAISALKETSMLGLIYNEASAESISGNYGYSYYAKAYATVGG